MRHDIFQFSASHQRRLHPPTIMKLCYLTTTIVLGSAVANAQTNAIPSYTIPTVDVAASDALSSLMQALSKDGIVAIQATSSDFESIREAYFSAATACVHQQEDDRSHRNSLSKIMFDGTTLRQTLSTNAHMTNIPASLQAACPSFVDASMKYEKLVEQIMHEVTTDMT